MAIPAPFPSQAKRLLPLQLHKAFGSLAIDSETIEALDLAPGTAWGGLEGGHWADIQEEDRLWLADKLATALRTQARLLPHHLEIPNLALFPRLDDLDSIDLSNRASGALRRASYRRSGGAAALTASEICNMPNVGSKTLVEVLSASDDYFEKTLGISSLPELRVFASSTRAGRSVPDDFDLQEQTQIEEAAETEALARFEGKLRRLRSKPWAYEVFDSDPTLSRFLNGFNVATGSVAQIAAELIESDIPVQEIRPIVEALGELEAEVADRLEMTADEEIDLLLETCIKKQGRAEMLVDRVGLRGRKPKTLNAVGQEHSVTRERVRQVEKHFRETLLKQHAWMPRVKEALLHIAGLTPSSIDSAAVSLRQVGLLGPTCDPRAVLRFGRFLGYEVGVVASGKLFLPVSAQHLPVRTRSAAGKLTEHLGCCSVQQLADELALPDSGDRLVELIVEDDPELTWLDEEMVYLWMPSKGRNRLLNQASKIISAAGSCDLVVLRDGIGRHHRMREIRPPREVLARVLTGSGLFRREGERIVGSPTLGDPNEVLSESEKMLREVILESGPLMTREQLRQELVNERGMKMNSFSLYLSYSPVIERFGRGVFGLRGIAIETSTIEKFLRENETPRGRVLLDSGRTHSGEIWFAYRLSAGAISAGVFSVPASFTDSLSGSFDLYSIDNDAQRLGNVGLGGGSGPRLWGLGPLFRRKHPEEGDHLVLTFDTTGQKVVAHLGSEELVREFAES
jgi:hypothetical protein